MADHHNHEVSHTERNRAHWDKSAATYHSDQSQEEFGNLINKVIDFVRENVTWIGVDFLNPGTNSQAADDSTAPRQVRVLDYACGPGTVTNALVGYASEFVGIDLSEKMVEEYNRRFDDASNGSDQKLSAKAYNADLLDAAGPPASLDDSRFFDFDLAVVGLGFHHFENLEEATKRLAERLKPGGVLLIVDFLTHPKNDLQHEAVHTVAHHGFGEQEVRSIFGSVGLQDTDIVFMNGPVFLRGTAKRTVFMARGRKV